MSFSDVTRVGILGQYSIDFDKQMPTFDKTFNRSVTVSMALTR